MRARISRARGALYLVFSGFVALGLIFSYFNRNNLSECEGTDVKARIRGTSQPTMSTFSHALGTPGEILALRCGNNGWYHRLGNNVVSILSAAARAYSLGMRFGIVGCEHSILNLTSWLLPDSSEILVSYNPEEAFHLHMIRFSGSTRQQDQGKQFWALEFIFPLITPCISRDLVRPMLSHLAQSERKYSEDALVIHIRSGDIMPGGRAEIHPLYAPPPLSYYHDIVDQHVGFREVVIVTETDHMNPVVERLMELFPSIKLQTGSLEEDISVILHARYLVASHSTFAWSLALGSQNIELLYTFNNGINNLDDRVFGETKVIQYYTDNYFKEWKATDEQMDYILNFPRDQLKQKVYANDYPCDKMLGMLPGDEDGIFD